MKNSISKFVFGALLCASMGVQASLFHEEFETFSAPFQIPGHVFLHEGTCAGKSTMFWCHGGPHAFTEINFLEEIATSLGVNMVGFDFRGSIISGTPGQDDGLLNSWLGTSLKISPREQVIFLEKMLATSLEVSKGAQIKTKSVMEKKDAQGQAILWKGWKLFAKTGGGQDAQRWFVGWGEKGEDKIVFAQYIGMIQDTPAIRVRAPMALDLAKESIEKLLEHM